MMDDLLKRLEEATEGSRELDAEIGETLGIEPAWYGPYGYYDAAKDAPREHEHYTTSLDAALTLVPEGWDWAIVSDDQASVYRRKKSSGGYEEIFDSPVEAATPALALCVASLKAIEARS